MFEASRHISINVKIPFFYLYIESNKWWRKLVKKFENKYDLKLYLTLNGLRISKILLHRNMNTNKIDYYEIKIR